MKAEQTMGAQAGGDRTTDEVVVILNVSHMFMIVMTALFFAAMFTDLGPDGTMRWVVAAGVILFSDLAFIGIGIALAVAMKSTKISKGNHWVVWLTVPLLSIPPLPELYEGLIGFFPTDHQIAWFSIAVSGILFLWTWVENIPFWKRVNATKGK
ncbi:MAG: hypothetical protein HQK87_02235 [Nitrospinae bacterium]|nr:hypothetical protein [Nitrospinota bacterium]